MRYYLGLDNGGTMTKAALYTKTGEEIGVAAVETAMFSVSPGFTERDMVEMKDANFEVIRKLLTKTKVDAKDIVGVACCGHGKGLYLWGKNNEPVRAGIISTDNRAWEYPENWKKDGTAKKVFQKTYQQILACQPVSLLAWLKDHEPEIMDDIKWVFECKDYVRFCLTGEPYAEITDYSGANLINLETRGYDEDLLKLFGLSEIRDCLPPIKTSTDICGYITEDVAKETGLISGTPVMGGMFDINACALAVDAAHEDRICMIAGTWSINEYIRKTPVVDGSVALNSIFTLPEYYLIEESSPTSAGNNEWFIKTMLPELKDIAEQEGKSIYDITNAWVKSIPVDEFCPIFLPFLMASNVHPNAKGSFIGMSNYHNRAHMVKGIYEGIAFSHRYHLDKLLASRTDPVSCIRLAGGVAHSDEWIQIFADVMGYPIEVVDIGETGTLGCAMNVAVALGDYDSYETAADNMINVREAVLPIDSNESIYKDRYAVYMKIIDALDPVWTDMQKLID